jgi:hypothetical protein
LGWQYFNYFNFQRVSGEIIYPKNADAILFHPGLMRRCKHAADVEVGQPIYVFEDFNFTTVNSIISPPPLDHVTFDYKMTETS